MAVELRKSDFYFDLPEELIAQDPLEERSSSSTVTRSSSPVSICLMSAAA